MDHSDQKALGISDVLRDLPLFRYPSMFMQAMNIDLVDRYLRNMEDDLVAQFIETDEIDLPQTMLVSALSQMWVFALYELLRTWNSGLRS